MKKKIISVNGTPKTLVVDPEASLSSVLREQLGLTGTKVGCDTGQCGACSVIMDGKVVKACITKMKRVPDEAQITTIEGIGTPGNLHPLQLAWIIHGAAQCGFCTSGFIVSSKALLNETPSPSREDVREWFNKHRNACRCTGYKQLVDAVMDAAKVLRGEMKMEALTYELPEDSKIWGTSYPRPSAVAKVTGAWNFGADLGLQLPSGTLQLALVQAKVSHANILSIDTSEAEKMPGVSKVITHKDIKGNNRIPAILNLPTNTCDAQDRPILCDKKVFRYDDPIAIVCADTEAHAKAAAEKVKIAMEELPAYMNVSAAMAHDAMEIHPGQSNVFFVQNIVKGKETGPIFKNAEYTVEDEFYVQRQPHMPIEPDVGFAYVNEEGKLVIHSKSCALHMHTGQTFSGVGIEPENLIMVQNPSGGDFGQASQMTIQGLLGVACLATGRPVFLKYDYRQQMTSTGKQPPFSIKAKLAADKEGNLLALEGDFTVDYGPYCDLGDFITRNGAQFLGAGYGIPNIQGKGRTVYTNHVQGSAFRALGATSTEFASEVLMDELAEKIGMDPLELRYKNVYRPGSTTPNGQAPEIYSLPEMLDLLRPGYKQALEKAERESTPEKKRGVGISVGVFMVGFPAHDESSAVVALMPDNSITVYVTWEDHGQGADMGTLGTAHEALRPLGVSPEQIKLVMNDTSVTPPNLGSVGSRSQVVTGRAIQAACELLLNAMGKDDGTYRTHEEMVNKDIPLEYTGKWAIQQPDLNENCQGDAMFAHSYGVFMAEVEVDTSSGKTKVMKMTCVADVGTINNKLVVDGQLYGGMAQGIGLALSEDFEDIKKHSTLAGAGFPYIKQIPDDMELIYVETPRVGPFGAGGCGELPLTTPHAAIINGIYNATGVRICKLPALPEKVLAGLKASA